MMFLLGIKDQKALVERYNAKKGQITGLAYCEKGAKAEIETRLEERYDDDDVEVSTAAILTPTDTLQLDFKRSL